MVGKMRPWASILHLDLDAFFAAVEQRDKPSLRNKPVVVGGIGARSVVATASYEARNFGVHSAMSAAEAHRRAPHAAYLAGRFDAYRQSSDVVMSLLRQLSPLVEPLSLDEAFVDLAAGGHAPESAEGIAQELRNEVEKHTEGLTASVGLGTSKFMAKVASELAKPNGLFQIRPGTEVDTIAPLPVRAIPGVGPVTEQRLAHLGIRTVADLQRSSLGELVRGLGESSGHLLAELAQARDVREVVGERERKSISVEDTFETDLTDLDALLVVAEQDVAELAKRLAEEKMFARTVSVKVRLADFTTLTRSRTLNGATAEVARIMAVATGLLSGVDIRLGVRLLGVGVSSLVTVAQEPLIPDESEVSKRADFESVDTAGVFRSRGREFWPGHEVIHDELGRGWVWGSGLGRVTVRFETRYSGVGPVRTVSPETLKPAPLLPLDLDISG